MLSINEHSKRYFYEQTGLFHICKYLPGLMKNKLRQIAKQIDSFHDADMDKCLHVNAAECKSKSEEKKGMK